MASPSTPMHGKMGAVYRLRPNGFKGSGLNDATWGAYTESGTPDSAYVEVVIDSVGTPNKFKWRMNGGSWTTLVSITGSAQSLVGTPGTQVITFASTTGHTLDDQWSIGNLYNEATTEGTDDAQITDTLNRVLNPNAPPTWTDSGGKNMLYQDFANGYAKFDGTVANVVVNGDNSFVLRSGLQKCGYLIDWSLSLSIDMADISAMGDNWKTSIPGQAGGSGSANAYFIGNASFFPSFEDNVDGTQKYFYVELFNYDPDQDQTGDHFGCWVTFTNFNTDARIGDTCKESINFQLFGRPVFTENV